MTDYQIQTLKLASDHTFRVAFVSDIHADTKFMPARRIRDIVTKTNALGADLVVLGGDYSTQDNWRMTPLPLPETIAELANLHAPNGVVAILGNHDWWDDLATQDSQSETPETVDLMENAGIRVLRNDTFSHDHPAAIRIAALDSQMAYERPKHERHVGAHSLQMAMKGASSDTYNILLAHEPDIFAELGADVPIDLVLSGHTHGGQIRLFGMRPVIPSAYGTRFAYGHLREQGRDLIVSGGLGCSSIPLRLGVLPEIVLVTINGTKG